MNNFIFSLNATMPVFLVMVVGYVLRRAGMLNDAFCSAANKYVFKVSLPLLLFQDIAATDLRSDFNPAFVIYCMLMTTAIFLIIWALTAKLLPNKDQVGAFTQAASRSSAAILGIAFVENIYGNAGMTPMMIVAAVPLFNIYSVVILTFSAKHRKKGNGAIRTAFINVLKNPIILGILAGVPFSLLNITLPVIPAKTIASIASTATPVALLCVGAGFQGRKAISDIVPTSLASVIKLVVLPAVSLPLALLCGFHGAELIAVLIMVGSPTTVSCYIMAKNMDNDAELTSSVIVVTTLMASVTLTFWIFLLRTMGLI